MRTRARRRLAIAIACSTLLAATTAAAGPPTVRADAAAAGALRSGRHLFERETFGGNGRTCATCHLRGSGTLSPADARRLFARDPGNPLFLADGSDDGRGNGVERILADATILVEVPLAPNVRLVSDPAARTVTLRGGIPTVKNTAALDPVLMQDGREPDLVSQALGAIRGHAAATRLPDPDELERIASFQRGLFPSQAVRSLTRGRTSLPLPQGRNPAERRGRRFFEDRLDPSDQKVGQCALCHSGPLLNETNEFFVTVPPFVPGGRFQSVLVSELNTAGNPVLDFDSPTPTAASRACAARIRVARSSPATPRTSSRAATRSRFRCCAACVTPLRTSTTTPPRPSRTSRTTTRGSSSSSPWRSPVVR